MSRYGGSSSSYSRGYSGSSNGNSRGSYNNRGDGGYGGRSMKKNKDFDDTPMAAPDWNSFNLIPFEKCFYIESVPKRKEEVEEFRRVSEIKLCGNNIPDPIFEFSEIDLPAEILRVIQKNKWIKPTPIQSQGWPMALSGRDLVGIARTGSGKTLSYILPAIIHVKAQPKLRYGDGPICLVLVPTRELAQQVIDVVKEFCVGDYLKCCSLYGGAAKHMQLRELQRTPEIVVATPGRLIDLLKCKRINLQRTTYVVLDEADRMLDMGFKPQISQIFNQVRPDRQTLMWSATWPKDVQMMAREFQKDFIQVTIGGSSLQANKNITQIVEVVNESQKEDRVVNYLNRIKGQRAIIFVLTKKKADYVARSLKNMGHVAESIHGDKEQYHRDSILKSFKESRINLLVATDVASRGLDINDINYVINMDYPNQTEDYVHRIGRTARKDKFGTSYTLFTTANAKCCSELIKVLQDAQQDVPDALYNMGFIPKDKRRTNTRGTYSGMKRTFDDQSSQPVSKKFNGSSGYNAANSYNRGGGTGSYPGASRSSSNSYGSGYGYNAGSSGSYQNSGYSKQSTYSSY